MVIVRYREIPDLSFNPIFRIFISGSSESGKTHFSKLFLKRKLFNVSRIYYFHPDFYEDAPTNWQEELDMPVVFSSEFPKTSDFLAMPEYSCIVLDDLMSECVRSKCIDYLFRVLSGKRKLHVMIMSQRYFVHERFSTSIRNSSNYHVLMRNTDMSNSNQIGRSLGLKQEILSATEFNQRKEYPYIFIDRTNKARARDTQVYIDILSQYFVLIRGSMKFYLLSEPDFKRTFAIKDSELAEYVDEKREENSPSQSSSQSESKSSKTKSPIRSFWKDRVTRKKRLRKAIHQYKIDA